MTPTGRLFSEKKSLKSPAGKRLEHINSLVPLCVDPVTIPELALSKFPG